MSNIERIYKAAAFVFHRRLFVPSIVKTVHQVYLQYEHKFNTWSHFGGKREVYDKDSFETALRELGEEKQCSKSLFDFLDSNHSVIKKKYFQSSKMIVYYVDVNDINNDEFIEADWFCIDTLPSNIRSHISPQIKILEVT